MAEPPIAPAHHVGDRAADSGLSNFTIFQRWAQCSLAMGLWRSIDHRPPPLFMWRIFKAFWDFRRTKMGHHKLKIVQEHLF